MTYGIGRGARGPRDGNQNYKNDFVQQMKDFHGSGDQEESDGSGEQNKPHKIIRKKKPKGTNYTLVFILLIMIVLSGGMFFYIKSKEI